MATDSLIFESFSSNDTGSCRETIFYDAANTIDELSDFDEKDESEKIVKHIFVFLSKSKILVSFQSCSEISSGEEDENGDCFHEGNSVYSPQLSRSKQSRKLL